MKPKVLFSLALSLFLAGTSAWAIEATVDTSTGLVIISSVKEGEFFTLSNDKGKELYSHSAPDTVRMDRWDVQLPGWFVIATTAGPAVEFYMPNFPQYYTKDDRWGVGSPEGGHFLPVRNKGEVRQAMFAGELAIIGGDFTWDEPWIGQGFYRIAIFKRDGTPLRLIECVKGEASRFRSMAVTADTLYVHYDWYNQGIGWEEGVDRIALTSVNAVADYQSAQPLAFALFQNYPNPFNPTTSITYDLPTRSHIRLTVFNAMGQVVANLVDGEQNAGSYRVSWNGANLDGSIAPSGIYFYRLEGDGFAKTRKMTLMK